MLGSRGEVYAGGSFDVLKVNDGFNQFEQDSPFADSWDWTKEKATIFVDWLASVLSKITEVVVDTLA